MERFFFVFIRVSCWILKKGYSFFASRAMFNYGTPAKERFYASVRKVRTRTFCTIMLQFFSLFVKQNDTNYFKWIQGVVILNFIPSLCHCSVCHCGIWDIKKRDFVEFVTKQPGQLRNINIRNLSEKFLIFNFLSHIHEF